MSPLSIRPDEALRVSPRGKDVLAGATGAAGVGAIGAGTALTVPSLVGFSASGVVANSAAATWQGSIGNVAAQSTFATLQWFGATTAPLAPVLGPVLVVVGVGTVCCAYKLASRAPSDRGAVGKAQ
ncbi:hypothetical protein T484DRAFT_1782334 [Baffinella frigidus]|nr:hypothetical protein T484DRAFT_1782334 [Cryptophyta sp. CCMP2293]